MIKSSNSHILLRSESLLPLSRILLALVGVGLILLATRAVAAPPVSDRPTSAGDRSGSGDRSGAGRQDRGSTPSAPSSSQSSGARSLSPGSGGPAHQTAHSLNRRANNAPIIAPRPLPRCSVVPNQGYWKHRDRDILAEIQWMARRGSIAVTPVPDDAKGIEGYSQFPAGWRAYGFNVPASGVLHVRLHHPNEGWFSLKLVDKWGGQEKGMLQVPIYTGNPEVTYTNPFKEPRAVFVIVDDPGWMSGEKNLYTLSLEKSWKPSGNAGANAGVAVGIWAVKPNEALTPAPEKKVVPPEKKG